MGMHGEPRLAGSRATRCGANMTMQKTARYIQELSTELSQLASQNEMRDLAYLLSLAAEERARAPRPEPAPASRPLTRPTRTPKSGKLSAEHAAREKGLCAGAVQFPLDGRLTVLSNCVASTMPWGHYEEVL
jgi:hypothetical protein